MSLTQTMTTYQPGLGVEAMAVGLKGAFLFGNHLDACFQAIEWWKDEKLGDRE